MATEKEGRIFELFARMLEYPQPGLAQGIDECETLVASGNPKAAGLLREFRAFVEKTPAGRLEEVYTSTFDLNTVYHPCVGYHLFGESYKRSVFIIELKERYRQVGLEVGTELPDHLALVMRYLAGNRDHEAADELIEHGLLPALAKMLGQGTETSRRRRGRNGYEYLLRALQVALEGRASLTTANV